MRLNIVKRRFFIISITFFNDHPIMCKGENMEKHDVLSALDTLVHQNLLLAERLQGTIFDRWYHFFFEVFDKGEIPNPHTHPIHVCI